MISTTKNNKAPRSAGKVLAVLFWVAVWQILYLIIQQEILIVSPARVLQRLYELTGSAEFWISALYSMLHVLQGFLLGVLVGVALAVLTSASKALSDLFYPLISMIKATPVVSFIILALVWLHSDQVPAFTAFLEVTPIVLGNVANGIAKTDRGLLQMARCYRFGAPRTVRRVYIPSIMPYFTAACTTGMGLAWKTAIAAEVLANTGLSIGGRIYDSKVYLETADLFAWTAVVIVLSVVLERLMVLLMKKIGQRYNVS
jgi:ABC-type nitrate/sulfonate/bicarbonate transport system, permease component